jgi:hypothetical protein
MEAESSGSYTHFEMWCQACDVEPGDTLNILIRPTQDPDAESFMSRGIFKNVVKKKAVIVLESGSTLFFNTEEPDCGIVTVRDGIEYACRISSPNHKNPLRLKDIVSEK